MSKLEQYLNKHYPFVLMTDDSSKQHNMLMAIRRVAFTEGSKFDITL